MVVLATAAMVTRQVSTGGVSKVAARASKWKEMEGENRAAFIRSASTVPSGGGRPLALPLNVSRGNADYEAAQCMQRWQQRFCTYDWAEECVCVDWAASTLLAENAIHTRGSDVKSLIVALASGISSWKSLLSPCASLMREAEALSSRRDIGTFNLARGRQSSWDY